MTETDSSSSKEAHAALNKWCNDLTQQARDGEIDPVIGREAELRQVIDILLRRRQNNPILVGEAVGKTAVVEALARKLASGDVLRCCKGRVCFLWIWGGCKPVPVCAVNLNHVLNP